MVAHSPIPRPVFKAIRNIDARRGYRRCSLPGQGLSFVDGPQANTDFWRDISGTVIVRFSSQGYVYFYAVRHASEEQIDDEFIESFFPNCIHKLLLAWLVDGINDSPLYCDE